MLTSRWRFGLALQAVQSETFKVMERLLDHRAGKFKLDCPIKPNSVDCHRIKIAAELRAGSARKTDHARAGYFSPKLFNQTSA
jgi:hypothetical protein